MWAHQNRNPKWKFTSSFVVFLPQKMHANWVVPKNALNSAMEVIQKITYRGILCVSANKIWFFTLLVYLHFFGDFWTPVKGWWNHPNFLPRIWISLHFHSLCEKLIWISLWHSWLDGVLIMRFLVFSSLARIMTFACWHQLSLLFLVFFWKTETEILMLQKLVHWMQTFWVFFFTL